MIGPINFPYCENNLRTGSRWSYFSHNMLALYLHEKYNPTGVGERDEMAAKINLEITRLLYLRVLKHYGPLIPDVIRILISEDVIRTKTDNEFVKESAKYWISKADEVARAYFTNTYVEPETRDMVDRIIVDTHEIAREYSIPFSYQ